MQILCHSAEIMLQNVAWLYNYVCESVLIVPRRTLSALSSSPLQWAVCRGQKMPAQKHRRGVRRQVYQEETQQIEPSRGVQGGHRAGGQHP